MYLSTSKRCELFEEIAAIEWRHLIRNHSAKMDVSEIGITKDIISHIRNSSLANPNFGVWSNPGTNENLYGSDIDIFVETKINCFIWYALQAKALQKDGTYHDMGGLRNNEYQWEKLERLKKLTGCTTGYLLYNGVANFTYNGIDMCNRSFSELQFGCSLVEPGVIAKIAVTKNPTFNDLHPKFSYPWRIITCCLTNIRNAKLYTLSQIQKAISHYPEKPDKNFFTQQINDLSGENINTDIINQLSEQAGWFPQHRILIRSTSGLNSQEQ